MLNTLADSIGRVEVGSAECAAAFWMVETYNDERQARSEMQRACEAQASLFPRKLPILETLTYGGVCVQAHQFGGDHYDFLDLGNGRLGMVISDVAGKGLGAALQMASLRATVRSLCLGKAPGGLEDLLDTVNCLFYESSPLGCYATLFFAEYDDQSRLLRYVNCGHFAPLLVRRDGTVARLESTCGVLGLFETLHCCAAAVRLEPGDTLLLYTDGASESRSAEGDEFGDERLTGLLCSHPHLTVSGLLQAILDAVRAFSHGPQDDVTLVCARCEA